MELCGPSRESSADTSSCQGQGLAALARTEILYRPSEFDRASPGDNSNRAAGLECVEARGDDGGGRGESLSALKSAKFRLSLDFRAHRGYHLQTADQLPKRSNKTPTVHTGSSIRMTPLPGFLPSVISAARM